ncbi:TPA: metal-dependent transcriptional regulator [Clostridioides difficile]|nr:metal-dependent transcriptional regulator [Clostridioides difficile]EFH07283.1 iron dependent repressor DNA binding domain protein [Clostridioides difficile NAP08]EFH15679.1 iron dependent repressor DNA binding domain protein [Clostridioides difficile NAP07]AVD38383.1 metal-dependent transcriptional regulator [Clostridioides difficile]AVD41910.1 metal-dependent transcriptional regulator [Clostridioides difficile]
MEDVKMYESRENYLETILILEKKNGIVKSIDIAKQLNYSKASVSRAIGILKEYGFIIMEVDGDIVLTEEGRKKAEEIYEKHILITKFLVNTLGVSFDIAEKDACRIEHVISKETFEGIKKYLDKN